MPEDSADPPSGLFSGPEAPAAIGEMIAELRSGLGWSQGRLADELGQVSGHPITREYDDRVHHRRRDHPAFSVESADDRGLGHDVDGRAEEPGTKHRPPDGGLTEDEIPGEEARVQIRLDRE